MMKLGRVFGGFAAAVVIGASGLAQPDLVVSRVRVDPEMFHPRSVVAVAALVENVGTEAPRVPFDVRFRDDGEEISRSVVPAGLGAGETREIFAGWVAEAGVHEFFVDVDRPSDAVRETDEKNNSKSLSVDVKEDSAPRVAVVEFDDHTRARLDNLGIGVADKLAARLSESGIRVIGRGDVDSWMQEAQADPTSPGVLSLAADALGVDYVVVGVVDDVTVSAQTLDLGIVRLGSATAAVGLSAHLVSAEGGAVTTEQASGSGEGATNLSLYLGDLFSTSPSCDVCAGGLLSERAAYAEGELVSLGYRNGPTPGWFGLEVYGSDGTFLRWLGWRFVESDGCETWFWNQRNGLGSPVESGIYTARLRDGETLTDTTSFQIRPSLSLTFPALDQVTVGTTAFDDDVVGVAIDDAVAELAASLLSFLLPDETSAALPVPAEAQPETVLLGQIASTLADGRVTVNIGASNGVGVGDRFEVLAVDHLAFDPVTLSVVSYDVTALKGEIEIVEVRERASTGVCLGSCDPSVGDLARLVP